MVSTQSIELKHTVEQEIKEWQIVIEELEKEVSLIGIGGEKNITTLIASREALFPHYQTSSFLKFYHVLNENRSELNWNSNERHLMFHYALNQREKTHAFFNSISSPKEAYEVILDEPSFCHFKELQDYAKVFMFEELKAFYLSNNFQHVSIIVEDRPNQLMPTIKLSLNNNWKVSGSLIGMTQIEFDKSFKEVTINKNTVQSSEEFYYDRFEVRQNILNGEYRSFKRTTSRRKRRKNILNFNKKQKNNLDRDDVLALLRIIEFMKRSHEELEKIHYILSGRTPDKIEYEQQEIIKELETVCSFISDKLQYNIKQK